MPAKMMTQSELVEEIAEATGFSRSDTRNFLTTLTNIVETEIENGHRVKVAHVTIEPKLRKKTKARMGRNPRTGEDVKIPAKPESVKVKARVGKALQELAPEPSVVKRASKKR